MVDLTFHAISEGAELQLGRARVTSTRLNHPWTALAYRIEVDGAVLVYCADTAPFTDLLLGEEFVTRAPALDQPLPPDIAAELARMRAGVVAIAAGADLLIYDTQFTHDEYRARPHWGHSHPDDAIAIAREARAKRLCLFHHAPLRSDDDNDAILARTRKVVAAAGDRFEVISAYEGLELVLGDA